MSARRRLRRLARGLHPKGALKQSSEQVARFLEVLVLAAGGLTLNLNEAQAIEAIARSVLNQAPLLWTQRRAAWKIEAQDDLA